MLDLVSGAMTSLREAARPSSSGRPLRIRPRRALAIPLRPYALTSAIGQLFVRRLVAFHSHKSSDYFSSNGSSANVVSLDDLIDSRGIGFFDTIKHALLDKLLI